MSGNSFEKFPDIDHLSEGKMNSLFIDGNSFIKTFFN
jgi:hypothetical protein